MAMKWKQAGHVASTTKNKIVGTMAEKLTLPIRVLSFEFFLRCDLQLEKKNFIFEIIVCRHKNAVNDIQHFINF